MRYWLENERRGSEIGGTYSQESRGSYVDKRELDKQRLKRKRTGKDLRGLGNKKNHQFQVIDIRDREGWGMVRYKTKWPV